MEAFNETFVGCFRHSAATEGNPVNGFRDGEVAVDRILLCPVHTGDQIQIQHRFCFHHAVQLPDLIQMLRFPAVAVHQAQVKHILLIHKPLPCGNHVCLGHQQADKQAGTKGNDHHDGNISAKGFDDGLPQISAHGVPFHYHSISAIS